MAQKIEAIYDTAHNNLAALREATVNANLKEYGKAADSIVDPLTIKFEDAIYANGVAEFCTLIGAHLDDLKTMSEVTIMDAQLSALEESEEGEEEIYEPQTEDEAENVPPPSELTKDAAKEELTVEDIGKALGGDEPKQE